MLIGCFLLAGFLGSSATAPVEVIVRESDTATLPCPHATGDVTWSRHTNSGKVVLCTVKNGKSNASERRYSILGNNSLVIRRVQASDVTTYLCNGKPSAYLRVSSGSDTEHGSAAVPPGPGPDPQEPDAQDQSHAWRVAAAVGAAVGAALVLLTSVTFRFYFKRKAARKSDRNETASEAIYEDIEDNEGDEETISSSSNRAVTDECVYSLVQKPADK